MNRHSRTAGRILMPALALGLAGDFLFRGGGPGLNAALWTAGLVAGWPWLRQGDEAPTRSPEERGLLLIALAIAAALLWRDNEMLVLLDVAALLVVFTLLPLAASSQGSLSRLTAGQAVVAAFRLALRGVAGILPAVVDAERSQREAPAGITLRALARGTLLTLPVALIFGGLLGSADPAFGAFLRRLVRVDPEWIAGHGLGVLACAWAAAAVLSGTLPAERQALPGAEPSAGRGLGVVEMSMLLGTVDLLFAGFVAFQLPYFFGGDAFVQRWSGVTYAEYARRGFFELVVVSALVLPLLLLVEARLPDSHAWARRLYRALAGAQLVLVLVIMASAMHRMALYQRQFGLTEDRFFASALMAGLAVTCCWFGATVLRGATRQFLPGALVAWAVWLGLLNAANPGRIIARVNLDRAVAGRPLDTRHLGRMSGDAIPAIVASLDRLSPSDRDTLVARLRQREDLRQTDWRAWNLGRARAARLIGSL